MCEISGSHGGEYVGDMLLESSSMYTQLRHRRLSPSVNNTFIFSSKIWNISQ